MIGSVLRRVQRRVERVVTGRAPEEAPTHPYVFEDFPAGFRNWNDRRTNRLTAMYPAIWKATLKPTPSPSRVAVVMHVYYTDLVGELIESLAALPVDFDLLVTNASGSDLQLDVSGLPRLGNLTVLEIENHGRDILPLVSLVNADLLEPYELVLKVHTKKSEWRHEHADLSGSGEEWRSGFLAELVGSESNVTGILNQFAADPSVGALTSQGNVLGEEFWGGDERIVRDLLLRLQLGNDAPLEFAAGSMYWIRGFLLQGLRALQLTAEDFEPEAGQIDATTAHAVERIIGILTREAGYSTKSTDQLETQDVAVDGWRWFAKDAQREARARVLPFYLPQFHTFPENDAWWGKGFTEWSNVAAAKPLYLGHNQPLLPGDLGFYDLNDPAVRSEQYKLAREAGIEGFMYYYYWFAGTKLMDMPIERQAAGGDDEPFCIMWANENWTSRWDGRESNVLIGQEYERVPASQFIHDVLHLLTDPRYIRINGKPVLAVYRITQIPDFESVLEGWREVAREAGLDGLTVLAVDVSSAFDGIDGGLAEHGLDGFLGFPPHNMHWAALEREGLGFDYRLHGNTLRYDRMVRSAELDLLRDGTDHRYPGVMVNFDNTARRQWQPDLWYGSNPYTFRRWLDAAVSSVALRDRDDRVIFLNAWNEWAEGAVLEPTQRFGKTYLLAVRDVLFR